MAEIFAVPIKGIGKPDYTREIALGQVRPGFTLKYLEGFKVFGLLPNVLASPWGWVTPPVPAGAMAHAIDGETNLVMPFTVPQGFTLDIFSFIIKPREDVVFTLYLDGDLYVELGIVEGGFSSAHSDIVEIGTSLVYPTGATSHTFDIQCVNLGTGALQMGSAFYCFFRSVGTPPFPEVKTIKCKGCGNEVEVPVSVTRYECQKCHTITMYLSLAKYKGSGKC